MAFGLGTLRLSPKQFWQLTLPELSAALHGITGSFSGVSSSVISQKQLDKLVALYPDSHKEQQNVSNF